jgi:hypothetical protein
MNIIKKYKEFNEELKSSTYHSASSKLTKLGHERRGEEMKKWADLVSTREKEERCRERLMHVRKFDPFEMTIYKCRWNRDTKTTIEEYLIDGLFYVEPSFPYDWFSDMVYDWRHDGGYSLWLPLELGMTPANEETSVKMKEIESKLSDESDEIWDNIFWPTRIMVELIPEGSDIIIDNGRCSIESRESDIALFSNRRDAIKFKQLLSDSIEGKNTFGKNQWYPNGISSAFENFFRDERANVRYRINKGQELLYNAKWYEPTYNNESEEGLNFTWFCNKNGYKKEDIRAISMLRLGETWHSEDHDVTAVKCDDIEKSMIIKESDIPKIANSIRKMSVNKLYRN